MAETLSISLAEAPLTAANPLEDMEVSENGYTGLRFCRLHERQIISGLGLSLCFHTAVLALAVLTPFFFAPTRTFEAPFVTVNLIEAVGSGDSTEDGPGGSTKDLAGTAAQQITEPEKPLHIPCKPAPLKDGRRASGAHKSVTEPSAGIKPDQAAPSTSSDASLFESRSSSIGDGAPLDNDFASTLGGGEGESADAGSGVNPVGSGGRGKCGVSEEPDPKQVDTPPTAIKKIEPEFPPEARRMGMSGRVVLKLIVKKDGSVGKTIVLEADPPGIFEQSALDAVGRWRFKPGRYRGDAVATWVMLPIQFRLCR